MGNCNGRSEVVLDKKAAGWSCCGTGQVGWARPMYDRADQGMIGQKKIYEVNINQCGFPERSDWRTKENMMLNVGTGQKKSLRILLSS